jgi:hypothetical protein
MNGQKKKKRTQTITNVSKDVGKKEASSLLVGM